MATSSNGWSALLPGKSLFPGERLVSRSGEFKLVLNGDGNLVAIDGSDQAYWASNTQGHPDLRLEMGGDGNLLLLDSHGIAWWDTYEQAAKNGHPYPLPQDGSFLVVQDDGNDVLYAGDWTTALWNSRQDTYDHGSDVGKWLAKAEVSAIGAVAAIAKITKAALPIIDAALIASGNPEVAADINNAVNSAIEAGNEIQAVDESLKSIADAFPPNAIRGFQLAVGLLNSAPDLSPAALANARAGLSTAEQAAFDKTLEFAPQITDNPTAISAARQPFKLAPGKMLIPLAPPKFGIAPGKILVPLAPAKLSITPGTPPLAILSAAAAPKVAAQKPATVTNILDVLQRTRVAAAATRAAAPVHLSPPPPPPPPSSSSNGGVVAAVAAAAAAAFILFRR